MLAFGAHSSAGQIGAAGVSESAVNNNDFESKTLEMLSADRDKYYDENLTEASAS